MTGKTVGRCPNCGAKIRPGMAFCSGCGARLVQAEPAQPAAQAFCQNCGAPLAPGAAFCTSCGTRVEQPAAPGGRVEMRVNGVDDFLPEEFRRAASPRRVATPRPPASLREREFT